jgi:pimeloyl-ACP methyl ester carboxylesterase
MGAAPHDIDLTARDGTRIRATCHPAAPGAPGVVVVHGAGSRRENHADFARRAAALGMWVIVPDLRGHGMSGGEPGPGMLDDVHAALDALAVRGAGALGLRGSSLGGFLALHAAAVHPGVRACVAICPAAPHTLARRYGAWPNRMPLTPAVARADGVARGYWHATGDEAVPWACSFALAQHTPQPRHLRVSLGGHHRSLQHDPRVQRETLGFLREHLT